MKNGQNNYLLPWAPWRVGSPFHSNFKLAYKVMVKLIFDGGLRHPSLCVTPPCTRQRNSGFFIFLKFVSWVDKYRSDCTTYGNLNSSIYYTILKNTALRKMQLSVSIISDITTQKCSTARCMKNILVNITNHTMTQNSYNGIMKHYKLSSIPSKLTFLLTVS